MKNKKILITGASSGLGKALTLWAAEHFDQLSLIAKTSKKLMELKTAIGDRCQIYAVDLTDELALSQTLNEIIALGNAPDVILHCAGGGFKLHNPLLLRRDCLTLLSVNLLSAVQINAALIPKMSANGGIVIHIGSTASHAAHGSVAYNTAKSALAAYVRSLGRQLAASNVIVTGIAPGSFIAEGNNMFDFKKDKPQEFTHYLTNLPAKDMVEAKQFIPIIDLLCRQTTPLFAGCMLPVDAGEGVAYQA